MLTGQVDSDGRKISSNSEASGRFHTDWLNMMYPRLKLARNLLQHDGVMFVSIDDKEIDDLRKMCDEVFGEENRIAIICHKARASVSNDKIISSSHNFIVLYARNAQAIFEARSRFGLAPELDGFDKMDARGEYRYAPVDGPGGGAKGNPHYTFLGVTGYWRFSQDRMQRMYDEGRIEKVGAGLQQKYYLEEAKQSRRTDTTWWDDRLYTATASSRLKDLMGADPFDNPKPIELVRRMIDLWVREQSDVILDFFSGSGTSGHAVMAANASDGVRRRFILVQLPEPLDPDEANQRSAAEFCDKLGKPRNIAELTKERLRRAAKKIRDETPPLVKGGGVGDLGFRVFKLDSSNIRAWDGEGETVDRELLDSVEHLKPDRSENDVLYEVLLKLGLDLCVPIERKTIAGKLVHSVGAGALVVCLAENISRAEIAPLAHGIAAWRNELAPAGETTAVFRDSAFADDVAKTNLTAILKQHGVESVRSI